MKTTSELKKELRGDVKELLSGDCGTIDDVSKTIASYIENALKEEKESMELINGDKIEKTWEAGLKEGRKGLVKEIEKLDCHSQYLGGKRNNEIWNTAVESTKLDIIELLENK